MTDLGWLTEEQADLARKICNTHNKLLEFVKELADDSVYERYENLNELKWTAFELLKDLDL